MALTGVDPAAPPGPRPAGPPSARPGRASAREPATRRRPAAAPAARRRPAAAARSTTSALEQLHGRQPAGVGQLGQRGRQRDPGRDPDRGLQRRRHHDRQPDVLGDPQAGAHAAERLHLEHGDVGGLEVAHPVGVGGPADRLVGGDRHVDRRGVRAARSSTLGARLLDVLQPAGGAVEHARSPRPRCRRPRAPLASTRIRPSGPSASRTASSRAWSSARVWPGSATLTLAVRQPPRSTIACACSGPTAGTVTLTGTASRSGAGQSPAAASSAQRSQGSATSASYSRNGLHSPQPGRAADQHALADGDAAEPGAHRQLTRPSRQALAGASRSGLPLGSSGISSSTTSCRGAHERGCVSADPGPGLVERRASPTTNATSRLPHSSSGTPSTSAAATAGCSRSRAATAGRGHVDAAADHHVVDPAEHVQPAVLVEPAGVGGQEPAVDQHLGGQLGVAVVPVEERRPGDPDPAVGVERERDAVERVAVVDAAAGGLGRAVRRDHAHAGVLGRARRSAGSIGPPPSSTVWKRAQRVGVGRRAAGAAGSAPARRTGPRRRRAASRTTRAPRAAPARGRRPASGRRPARPRRTTPAARAASGRTPPSRRALACDRGEHGVARQHAPASGAPVEPDVSTTHGSGSSAASQPQRVDGSAVGPRNSRDRR